MQPVQIRKFVREKFVLQIVHKQEFVCRYSCKISSHFISLVTSKVRKRKNLNRTKFVFKKFVTDRVQMQNIRLLKLAMANVRVCYCSYLHFPAGNNSWVLRKVRKQMFICNYDCIW